MNYDPFKTKNYPVVNVKKGYKEWSKTYETDVEDLMDIRLLERITSIDWTKIKTAVDLACGTGRIGQWLKEQGIQTIDGVDFTREMIVIAEKKKTYRKLLNDNMLYTDLKDESYDLSIEVLADEHIEDLTPLYAEASRITRNEGFFVIIGYHPHFLMNGLITHYHEEDGNSIAIKSYVHLLSDHIKAAFHSKFTLLEMNEGIIDKHWLEKKPKWSKYQNRPVSFIMVWKKVN